MPGCATRRPSRRCVRPSAVLREAIAEGDKEKAGELLVSTSRKLDKAVTKGVIHKNQAANKKSALALALNKL